SRPAPRVAVSCMGDVSSPPRRQPVKSGRLIIITITAIPGDRTMNRMSLLWVGVLAAGRLLAQEPALPTHPRIGAIMGHPMAMQEMMGPMMPVMVYTPQHLLAHKEALGLTADQVARLTTLRAATQAAQDAAMGEAKAHMQELE